MGKEPKYKEIYHYFRQQIREGKIKTDEPLPQEPDIISMFDASHMTVNKAMTLLAQHGYIRRVPGYGTFACKDYSVAVRSSQMLKEGINQIIIKTGMTPRTELVSYKIRKGKEIPEIAKILKTEDEQFIHEIIRLKYGNERLICVTKAYLSQKLLPVVDVTRLENSLDEYVNDMGIQKTDGYSELKACLPDEELAGFYGTDHIALMHQRIMWNADNIPFELTDNYFDGELITITNPRRMEITSGIEN